MTTDEDKIQHTDALSLCNRLTALHSATSRLQHELVLHYSATGVPTHKTRGSVDILSKEMERVEEELESIRDELGELER